MTVLSNIVRDAMISHIKQAKPAELFAIAAGLCANEAPAIAVAELPIVVKSPRFAVCGEFVYDSLLDLTWTRGFVPGGKRDWAESVKAASEFRINGQPCRAPTVSERLSISDFERFNPAIDTSIFECPESGWEWTGSIYKPSPEGCAWVVYFGGGYSGAGLRSGYDGFVRAVCPGQFLATLT